MSRARRSTGPTAFWMPSACSASSPRSLRAYAFDLLHFARWTLDHWPPPLTDLTEAALEQYLRHQLDQQPSPAAPTINRRLGLVRALYRFHFASDVPGSERFPRTYFTRSPLGYGRPRPRRQLRPAPHRTTPYRDAPVR